MRGDDGIVTGSNNIKKEPANSNQPPAATMRRIFILSLVLVASCTQALKLSKDDSPVVLSHQLITAPNPGERGSVAI
jgi:hypothetical protein